MTKLATRGNKLSGVLAFEEEASYGVCRETAIVTVEAGMDVGAALTLVAGKYVWITAAIVTGPPGVGTEVAVVIENTKDVATLTPGDHTLTLLVRGHAGIVGDSLKFKDTLTTAQKNTVLAAFKAKNIHNRAKV